MGNEIEKYAEGRRAMKRIVVVDDEIRQCRGLRNILMKQYEGMEVHDFTSAAEALKAIKTKPPEIVITDICMPDMDGLELTERVRKIDESIKVILLTGFAEFEYARKAIKAGAFDYLLKPLNPDKLREVLERAQEERKKEEILRAQHEKMKKQLDMTLPAYMEKLLNQWVYGRASLSEQAEVEKVIPAGEEGFVIAVYLPGLAKRQAEVGEAAKELNSRLTWWMRGLMNPLWHCLSFFSNVMQDTMITIVTCKSGNGRGNLKESREIHGGVKERGNSGSRLLARIETAAEVSFPAEETGITEFRMGIGRLQHDLLHSIGTCYDSAAEVLQYFFYFPETQILRAEFILDHRTDRIGISLTEEELLKDALKEGNAGEAKRVLEAITGRCLAAGYPLPAHFKNVFENLLHHTALAFQAKNKFQYVLVQGEKDTCEAFIGQAESWLEMLAEEASFGKRERKEIFSEKLKAYLQLHYSEDVSLDDLASYFELAPAYCSALVKEAAGNSFSKLLLETRIRRAKDLLVETDLRIYEIAERTGYSDVKYFNRIFKRETGVTPIRYREECLKLREGSDEKN